MYDHIIHTPAGKPILCFGESLGLIFNPRDTRLRDCGEAGISFAGAESNTAIGIARLGGSAIWLSAVGDDPVGQRILRQLRAEGVDVSGVTVSPIGPTALMLRDRPAWAEPAVHYWRKGTAFSREARECVRRRDLAGVGAVFVSGITPALGPVAAEAAQTLAAAAKGKGIPVWLDVNYRRKLWSEAAARKGLRRLLATATGVFASEEEGRLLTRQADLPAMARALRALGPAQVIIKRGADGAHWFGGKEDCAHGSFPIAAVVDPVGAGDGFNAGFLSGVMEGAAVAECLRRGCACGAMACLSNGDWEGLPTRAEMERFIAGRGTAER